jgi:hypothetical protein
MSATEPVPTVADFLQAGAIALRTDLDPAINVRRGSAVDLTAGPAALAWAQEAARDRDLFRSVYTDSSSGAALEDRVLLRYGVPRIKATRGQGAMVLQRANDLAGGGTIYEGTRISLQRTTSTTPLYYSVAEDYVVPGGGVRLSRAPGEARVAWPGGVGRRGPGVRCARRGSDGRGLGRCSGGRCHRGWAG